MTAEGGESPLELGRRHLLGGDPAGAVTHLEAALAGDDGAGAGALDVHLLLAEALWQRAGGAGTREALPHYEAAAALAQAAGDTSKEGMVALGHGFALSQLGDAAAARERLVRARELAEGDGNSEAVRFVDGLLSQVGSSSSVEGPQAVKDTWRRFAEALSMEKTAVLFLRGTLDAPADAESQRGVSRLRAAGCTSLQVVDVCASGADVPEGLQGIAGSSHIAFPQLFVAGAELEAWLELPAEELRGRLAAAGVALGEPREAEPCHGTATFAEGLLPWEVRLVELVSKEGAGDWSRKAASLASEPSLAHGALDAPTLEAAWARLAPMVRERLEEQPEMPCGHSCSTCPTRHECQLHEALGEGARDIEDLAVGKVKG